MSDVDPQDQLFDDDFAADWTPLEFFEHPSIDQLPMAGADLIGRRLGINMADNEESLMRKVAAVEWFYRNVAGQKVTFRQVFNGGNGVRAMMGSTEGDPTPPPASGA